MLTMRLMGWRLRQRGLDHVHSYHDLTNAFGSTKQTLLHKQIEKLSNQQDMQHVQQRLTHFVCTLAIPEGMLELMQDKQVLYETMIHNIYDLGLVLKTKFALLKIAYTAFMLALILGVLSFIGVFVWILQQAG